MRRQLLRTVFITIFLYLLPHIGEAQWQRLAYNSSIGYTAGSFYNEVFFYDNNNGWITGFSDTVLHSTNAGVTWQKTVLPNAAGSANRDICFLSANLGFVSGEDGIWKTTNGGTNWTNITPNSTSPNRSASCWFIDGNVGVYGYGSCGDSTVTFWRTTDGGANWNSVSYTHNAADAAVGGMAYSGGTFYASGGTSKFWYSTDNGANWTYAPTNSGGWQEDLIVYGGTLYIASANGGSCSATGGGKVLRSTNNGSSWSTVSFPNAVMWGVSMYSSSDGWSCGDDGHAYKTTDGGANWTEYSCGIDEVAVDDIHFTDATHGWAVGVGIFKYVGDSYRHRPDSIDFGDILVGQTSADSIAWVKALGMSGTITARAIVGPDQNDFGATGGLAGNVSLTSCQEYGTQVHFNPRTTGVKRAYLQITLPGRVDTVVLKGNGVKPVLNAQNVLRFDTLLCSNEGLDTLSILNTGSYPLRISNATIQGASGGTFQIVTTTGEILPSQQGGIVVRVQPSGSGPVTGTLIITSNDPDPGKSPFTVQLQAYRRVIKVGFDQDTLLTLPAVPINTPTSGCMNYINKGDGTQTIRGVDYLTGGDASINLVSQITDVNVATTKAQQICFVGSSPDTGWHVRRFRVRTQPCDLDTFITVRYYTTNPIISASASRVFSAAPCESDLLDTVLIRNTGNEKLILQQPVISGTDGSDFTLISPPAWPDTIPVGGSRTLVVRFAPDADLRTRTATITFQNNDRFANKNPWVMALQGIREAGRLEYAGRTLDMGSHCLNEFPLKGAIAITNIGNGISRIKTVRAVDPSVPVVVLTSPAGRNLAAAGHDSIVFQARPVKTGPFTTQFVVEYDPCSIVDTLTVMGTVTAVDLTSSPATIDFGSQPIGVAATKKIQLTNKGNVSATISRLDLVPPVPGAAIIDPTSLPFTLAPGESREITVSITLTEEGKKTSSLVVSANATCPDTLSLTVSAEGTSAALFPTRTEIDFGSLIDCDVLQVTDTVSVFNLGTAPLEVSNVRPASGMTSRYTITPAQSLPHILQPGDALLITVQTISGTTGSVSDDLIVESTDPKRPEIMIPLRSTILTSGIAYQLPAASTNDTLVFETLYECSTTDEQSIVITNTGMTPDTVQASLTSTAFVFRDPGIASFILPPGGDTTIIIRAVLPVPAQEIADLRIVSQPCTINRTIALKAEHLQISSSLTDVNFPTTFLDQQPTLQAVLTNTGAINRRIARIELLNSSGSFMLVGSFDGTILDRAVPTSLPIKFTPTAAGMYTDTIRVIFAEPCPDTLIAIVSAVATDERYVIGAIAPSVRGRWGTTTTVPIGFRNQRNARLESLTLSVTASPQLLSPTSNLVSHAGVIATVQGYDPMTGKLDLVIRPSDANGTISTTDTLVTIEYDILRGDRIASPIELSIAGLSTNMAGETTDGDFALEDYCDAHGRLLQTTGSVGLKQNVPNPFNPTTTIEFETAFAGPVLLTVHDGIGKEVMRVIDENLPAGRRRVVIDAGDLPSGVYTYRLTTGLQVLTRRMVVAQ